jgi:hypothetical protein
MLNEENRLAVLNNNLLETNNKLASAAAVMHSASTQANSIMTNGTAMIVRQILSEYESTLNQIQAFLRNDVPPTLETLSAVGKEVRSLRENSSLTANSFQGAAATALTTVSAFNGSVDRLSNSVVSIEQQIVTLTRTVAGLESALNGTIAPVNAQYRKPPRRNTWWGFWRRRK